MAVDPSKLLYMYDFDDPTRVCLRNVFHNRVGNMTYKKSASYERKDFLPYSEFAYHTLTKVYQPTDDQKLINMLKETHRSIATVDSLYDGMKKYINNTTSQRFQCSTQGCPEYKIALKEIEKRFFSGEKFSALELDDIINDISEYLSEPGASAGYPFIYTDTPKKRDAVKTQQFKDDVFKIFENVDKYRGPWEYRKDVYPCVAYQKTSVVKPGKEEKVRFIWGYPLQMVALEALFAVPLIEHAKKIEDQRADALTSFRMTAYSNQYQEMIHKYGGESTAVTDYSAYDTTVPQWLISDIFDMIEDHLNATDRVKKVFQIVKHYFIHTPILFRETGTLFVKHHGIPSGSWFTNIVGSLANAVIMMTCNIKHRTRPAIMKVMGDDNLSIGGYNNFLILEKTLLNMFGVVINSKKCYAGPLLGAKFLGRVFSDDKGREFKGWKKSIADSMASLFFPAQEDNEIRYGQRLYSIYLDNPVSLLWKMVCKEESLILNALKYQFDTNENREVVFTVFNGDYERARLFFEHRSASLFSPDELRAKF